MPRPRCSLLCFLFYLVLFDIRFFWILPRFHGILHLFADMPFPIVLFFCFPWSRVFLPRSCFRSPSMSPCSLRWRKGCSPESPLFQNCAVCRMIRAPKTPSFPLCLRSSESLPHRDSFARASRLVFCWPFRFVGGFAPPGTFVFFCFEWLFSIFLFPLVRLPRIYLLSFCFFFLPTVGYSGLEMNSRWDFFSLYGFFFHVAQSPACWGFGGFLLATFSLLCRDHCAGVILFFLSSWEAF